MGYLILNALLFAFFVYFAHYSDRKIKSVNIEISSFSISLLFVCIESAIYTLALLCRNFWTESFISQMMKIVFVLDAAFFVSISSTFFSMTIRNKKPFLRTFIKVLLIIFAIFIIYFRFGSISVTPGKGIIIESEYLFMNPARKFFPWTWVTLFTAFYRYFLPILGYLVILIRQENSATQLEKYQSVIVGYGIVLMWIGSFAIQLISKVEPDFSLLFIYAYLFFISVLFTAWTKTSVPSGRGIFMNIVKIFISYIVPAVGIGFLCFLLQPIGKDLSPFFIVVFVLASALLVFYGLTIGNNFVVRNNVYTADYAVALEKDLAKIDYSDAQMDEITNQMFEILRKNIETSAMNVYILSSPTEVTTAYSSNGTSMKFPINTPVFDTLLNVNKSVVVYSQIEKDHDFAPIVDDLKKFFEDSKSDVLFVLNEGHNIFGLLTFAPKVSGDHYKEYDYNVFEKLYSYFFVFGYFMRNISNKDVLSVVNRELRMSSQIITSIQENIDFVENDKVDIGYLMVPAHNIGGEFIDMIRLTDTRHLFVIGDLSGQGIAGSMSMVILKSIIRTYLAETHDFKELVVKTNLFVRDSLRKGTIFAGLFALIDFETDTMYYINCGIPALFLYTQVYNNVIEIQGSGHILGFVKDISPYISVKTTKFSPGDVMFTCTDGLIQSHSLRGEPFGKERVQQAILDNSTYPAQRMAQFTFDGLMQFMSKEMEDDVSIFTLKYGKPEVIEAAVEEAAQEEVVEEPVVEESNEFEMGAPIGADITDDGFTSEVLEQPSVEAPVEEPVFEEAPVQKVEEPAPEPVVEEKPKVEIKHEAAPEGFDMSELSDLDDLLADVGL